MQADIAWWDKADYLIALHGDGAITALVGRITDAVHRCDDQAVGHLDSLLQLVEQRIAETGFQPPSRRDGLDSFRAALTGR